VGFERKILTSTAARSYVVDKLPNITRRVDWVFLHCDLLSRRVSNVGSDVLYAISTIVLRVSYPLFKTPTVPLEWHPINQNRIDAIRLWLTDGRNNALDLNGIDVAINILIDEA